MYGIERLQYIIEREREREGRRERERERVLRGKNYPRPRKELWPLSIDRSMFHFTSVHSKLILDKTLAAARTVLLLSLVTIATWPQQEPFFLYHPRLRQ